jgi:hypothetical protein
MEPDQKDDSPKTGKKKGVVVLEVRGHVIAEGAVAVIACTITLFSVIYALTLLLFRHA